MRSLHAKGGPYDQMYLRLRCLPKQGTLLINVNGQRGRYFNHDNQHWKWVAE